MHKHDRYSLAISFLPEIEIIFKVFLAERADSIRLVGGCVRDLLLQKKVADFDFATKFLPQEIINILKKNNIKSVPTGLKHGTITAVLNGKNFEITTLRKDNDTDGRHCEPEFIDDYRQDALRRDFTINAMYLDFAGKIHDYCGGLDDLENRRVRFIGDAKKRIEEDYLRILRFFRFSCFYANDFDETAITACNELKQNLQKLSFERIRIEIFKILSCEDNDRLLKTLQILQETKIAKEIAPFEIGTDDLKKFFIIEDKFFVRNKKNNDVLLKFFFCFFGKITENNLVLLAKHFVLTNKEKKILQFLLQDCFLETKTFALDNIKKLLVEFDKELVLDSFKVNLVKNFSVIDDFKVQQIITFIEEFVVPEFPLKGSDFLLLGFSGKKVGEKIEEARKKWIESDFSLGKDELIRLIL